MPEEIIVDGKTSLARAHQLLDENYAKHGYSRYSVSNGRTVNQNSALHKWFEMIAEIWNNAGISQKAVLEAFRGHDLPHSGLSVKIAYKRIMEALQGIQSTTEQTTVQPSEVIEELHRFSAERLGVVLPDFPSREI